MTSRMVLVVLAMAPACGFSSGTSHDGGFGDDDAPPDAQLCFGTLVRVCFTNVSDVPQSPPDLAGSMIEIDTGASTLCNPNNDQAAKYCVVAGKDFAVATGKTIRAYGTRPLVLLSTTSFVLQGTVDVSSSHMVDVMGKHIGAGANPAGCGGMAATADSGGFGGSFGGKGGDGTMVGGSAGHAADPLQTAPTELRGGCPGGNGSASVGTVTPGVGGSGGGAVAIIATTGLQVDGQIDASGAAGTGGLVTKSGGGGGGSGGMIVLDGLPNLLGPTGVLFANGGGGGQGGAGPTGNVGSGQDGRESTGPTDAGKGGRNSTTDGGPGGDGSSGVTRGGNPGGQAQDQGGGGGGGGGAGWIRAANVSGTNVAPPPK